MLHGRGGLEHVGCYGDPCVEDQLPRGSAHGWRVHEPWIAAVSLVWEFYSFVLLEANVVVFCCLQCPWFYSIKIKLVSFFIHFAVVGVHEAKHDLIGWEWYSAMVGSTRKWGSSRDAYSPRNNGEFFFRVHSLLQILLNRWSPNTSFHGIS